MTVTLVGTGGIITRLGRIFAAQNNINGFRGETLPIGSVDDAGALWGSGGATAKDAKTAYNQIEAQFQSNDQQLADGLYAAQASMRSSLGTALSTLQTLAQNVLVTQVNRDIRLPDQTYLTALKELIRQINLTDTVKANTVSVGAASALSTNIGTAQIVGSLVNPSNGLNNEFVFPETIQIRVTADGQPSGGGTLGSESGTIKGQVANAVGSLDWQYPQGSGLTGTFAIVDPTLSNQATANILSNSAFDTQAANLPTGWRAIVGTAGTDILTESSTVYRSGGKAIKFLGQGSAVLSSVAQWFANASQTGGSTVTLLPNTVYQWCIYARKTSGAAAGALTIRLLDGGTPSLVADNNSANNTTTIANGTLTTSYAAYTGTFRTPKNLPSTGIQVNIQISTAITNGESIYVDDFAMTPVSPLYVGGVYLSAFRSTTDVIANDGWNVAVANNMSGIGASGGLIQSGFERNFSMRANGLILPSKTDASQTINENLVS